MVTLCILVLLCSLDVFYSKYNTKSVKKLDFNIQLLIIVNFVVKTLLHQVTLFAEKYVILLKNAPGKIKRDVRYP